MDRADWMSVLAQAPAARLAALWAESGRAPVYDWIRRPEIGSVMVRGRTGGTGDAFNLGEVTVTRCALRLADGPEGHAYVQGRDRRKAEVAALVDALMQTDAAAELEETVVAPLLAERDAADRAEAGHAAATRVEFFTMTRGE